MGTDEKTPELFRRKTCDICGNKTKTTLFSVVFVVDDTRLELVTSRTSSGCATSCANRPALYQQEIYYTKHHQLSSFF